MAERRWAWLPQREPQQAPHCGRASRRPWPSADPTEPPVPLSTQPGTHRSTAGRHSLSEPQGLESVLPPTHSPGQPWPAGSVQPFGGVTVRRVPRPLPASPAGHSSRHHCPLLPPLLSVVQGHLARTLGSHLRCRWGVPGSEFCTAVRQLSARLSEEEAGIESGGASAAPRAPGPDFAVRHCRPSACVAAVKGAISSRVLGLHVNVLLSALLKEGHVHGSKIMASSWGGRVTKL